MNRRTRHLLALVNVLFIISGFTGLAYEIVWTRMLVRVFGATSYAVTTVLAAYMGGLALGSYAFGKRIDRGGNPLRVYGALEAGIGLFALVLPFILPAVDALYRAEYAGLEVHPNAMTAVRFVLCFLLLLVPTTLMGGTLPVLSKAVVRRLSEVGGRAGGLYAVNMLGAVGGTLAAAFLLLPGLGMSGTIRLAAALNFAIFGMAFLAGRAGPAGAPAQAPEEAPDRGKMPDRGERPDAEETRARRTVLLAFALTGFAALSVEVIWTRVLALVIGTTVYAFAVMLATFLLGLGLGSAVFARFSRRLRHPGRGLAALVVSIAAALLLSSAAFGRLPYIYMSFYERAHQGWGNLICVQFALCSLIMLLPAFLMGGMFPLAARLYARRIVRLGSEIGVLYAFNTLGSILGSVAGSFLFLRLLGVEDSLILISGLYAAVGIALMLGVAEFTGPRARWSWAGLAAAVLALTMVSMPSWDKKLMTSGVYRYAPLYRTVDGLKSNLRRVTLLFYSEGEGATVSVERFEDEFSLLIDGKADASTGIADMRQQTLLAYLPLLAHPDPQTVLVIGLGSGVTLGCAERFGVRQIDCVEILPNEVEATRSFTTYNYDCLADPRLSLIIGDGRNHLSLTSRSYDIIISHPTNPWISGVGDLFTREYFEVARSRLAPGGIMCAWFQMYHMSVEDLEIAVRTFLEVFPHVSMWMSNESDLIVLGSTGPTEFDGRLIVRMNDAGVASALRRVWIEEPSDILAAYVAGGESLRRWAGVAGPENTDDNMLLEFSAGRMVLASTEAQHLEVVARLMEAPPAGRGLEEAAARARVQAAARRVVITASALKARGGIDEAMGLYDNAYAMAPWDPFVLHAYAENHQAYGYALLRQDLYDEAFRSFRRSVARPDYPKAWSGFEGLAYCFLAAGERDSAATYFRMAADRNPYSADAFFNLGNLALYRGDAADGIENLKRSLEIQPENAGAAGNLARVYLRLGRQPEEAVRLAETAARIDGSPYHWITLGWARYEAGDLKGARRALEKAFSLEPDNTEALYRLARAEADLGRRENAVRLLRDLTALRRNDVYTRDGEQLLGTLEREGTHE
jgi:spermidine synthase